MNDAAAPAAPPPVYARFNARMIASMIDLFLVMLVATPLVEALVGLAYAPIDESAFITLAQQMQQSGNLWQSALDFWAVLRAQHVLERMALENLLMLGCIAAYTLPFWFRYSTTPGKMLLRLSIADEATGFAMTRAQAVRRFLGYIAAFLPLTLGFALCLFDRKRRNVQDFIAHTVVVVKPRRKKTQALA